ncbi:MAG TPA: hypothetical protein VMQ67_11415, partial [Candidatus Saccharimonadales bacterium]|nr:hypothetical protein [Candidatus Saccharimonadales bacterium]
MRIEFQEFGVVPQGLLEFGPFKGGLGFTQIKMFVPGQPWRLALGLILRFVAELKVDEPAHGNNCHPASTGSYIIKSPRKPPFFSERLAVEGVLLGLSDKGGGTFAQRFATGKLRLGFGFAPP